MMILTKAGTVVWQELKRVWSILMTEQEQDEHLKKCLSIIDEWAERNKPPTLYQLIQDKLGYSPDSAQEIIDVVAKWLPQSSLRNTYEWEKCLKLMREKLQ